MVWPRCCDAEGGGAAGVGVVFSVIGGEWGSPAAADLVLSETVQFALCAENWVP